MNPTHAPTPSIAKELQLVTEPGQLSGSIRSAYGGPPLWAIRWIAFSCVLCAGMITFFFWQFWDNLGLRQAGELLLIALVGPGFILAVKLPRDMRKHVKELPFTVTTQRLTLGTRRATWSMIVGVVNETRPEGSQLTIDLSGEAEPMVIHASTEAIGWLQQLFESYRVAILEG